MRTPSRYLWILPVAFLAIAGLVWNRPTPVSANKSYDVDDLHGRYISAENAYDVSSVHSLAAPNGSIVGPPVVFATAEVMQADGKGKVCGEADGFYGGTPAPGSNTGPSYYHGTYAVSADGRVTISTCSDSDAPTAMCTAADELVPCVASTAKVQVGYLQDNDGDKVDTAEQLNAVFTAGGSFVSGNFGSGFLVHNHEWSRDDRERENHDRRHDRD